MIWWPGSLGLRVYYRVTTRGDRVPARGPLLLVANHPNSLLDPALVVAAARRPVRFLAKAPLFENPRVGWLARATGAVPVYRRMDDPSLTGRNREMFRAVFTALRAGDAVGLFPEGVSHSAPSLEPLRTGAARIALGAEAAGTGVFPIVPVGLVHRDKAVFRSAALALLGAPIAWDDLAGRGDEDREAVRELTGRIETALRGVTVNLERWEDRPLVECAEAIWSVEHGGDPRPEAGIGRVQEAARILGEMRRGPDDAGADLVRQVEAHRARLERLGLQPADLSRDVGTGSGMRWAVRRLHLLGLPAIAVAIAGKVLFQVPYWVAARLAHVGNPGPDQLSTHRLLAGGPVYTLWVAGLALGAAWLWGPPAGLAALVAVPGVGMLGLWIRESWRDAWRDARSFFLLRSRRRLIDALRERQRHLARRLQAAYEAHAGGAP